MADPSLDLVMGESALQCALSLLGFALGKRFSGWRRPRCPGQGRISVGFCVALLALSETFRLLALTDDE